MTILQGMPAFIGPFTIHGRLGTTNGAIILDGTTADGRRVAVKWAQQSGDEEQRRRARARFDREMSILKTLTHPGIVRFVDAGESQGQLYLAVERIKGVTLRALVRSGSFDLPAALGLGIHVGNTLGHLHELGAVHRNISPDSMVIDENGKAILTDLGRSAYQNTDMTQSGVHVGGLAYVAPEVMNGERETPSSDQYALSRLLFDLSTARVERAAAMGTSRELDWSAFPKEGWYRSFREVLERGLSPRPHQRYRDMFAFVADLGRIAAIRAIASVSGEAPAEKLIKPPPLPPVHAHVPAPAPAHVFVSAPAPPPLRAVPKQRPISKVFVPISSIDISPLPTPGQPDPFQTVIDQLQRDVELDPVVQMTEPGNVEAILVINDSDVLKAEPAPLVEKLRALAREFCETTLPAAGEELDSYASAPATDRAQVDRVANHLKKTARAFWIQRISDELGEEMITEHSRPVPMPPPAPPPISQDLPTPVMPLPALVAPIPEVGPTEKAPAPRVHARTIAPLSPPQLPQPSRSSPQSLQPLTPPLAPQFTTQAPTVPLRPLPQPPAPTLPQPPPHFPPPLTPRSTPEWSDLLPSRLVPQWPPDQSPSRSAPQWSADLLPPPQPSPSRSAPQWSPDQAQTQAPQWSPDQAQTQAPSPSPSRSAPHWSPDQVSPLASQLLQPMAQASRSASQWSPEPTPPLSPLASQLSPQSSRPVPQWSPDPAPQPSLSGPNWSPDQPLELSDPPSPQSGSQLPPQFASQYASQHASQYASQYPSQFASQLAPAPSRTAAQWSPDQPQTPSRSSPQQPPPPSLSGPQWTPDQPLDLAPQPPPQGAAQLPPELAAQLPPLQVPLASLLPHAKHPAPPAPPLAPPPHARAPALQPQRAPALHRGTVRRTYSSLSAVLALLALIAGFALSNVTRRFAGDRDPQREKIADALALSGIPARRAAQPLADCGMNCTPTAQGRADANALFESAERALRRANAVEARENLVHCIELADLAECHALLGALLAVHGDARARPHLQHYLQLEPNAPDAAAIRAMLDH